MKSFVFLPIVASTLVLVAAAKPSHSFIAAILGRQLSQDLHERSGTDAATIATRCQSSCTSILNTLDSCTTTSCECTQSNYNTLANCVNCLTSFSSPGVSEPGDLYLTTYQGFCEMLGVALKSVAITAVPTGSPDSTVDPFSLFDFGFPTGTDLSGSSATTPHSTPTQGPAGSKSNSGNSSSSGNSGSSKKVAGSGGGAIGLSPVWALGTSAGVAIVVAFAIQAVSFL